MAVLRITLTLAAIIAFTSSVRGEPECEGYSTEQCGKFVEMGVATAYVNGINRVEDFIESMQIQFKKVIANVSNDYVILEVLPKHVLIVDVTYSDNDRVVVHFLVVNPSGSTVLPVAFRSHELYLMCKINDEHIDRMLDYSIVPIEPESDYKLAIPPWAIAISCYIGLVAVFYIGYTIYQANQQFKNMEDEFENYEMQSSMEKGHKLHLKIDTGSNDNPDMAYPPNEKGTQVRQHQIREETEITEVIVESPTSKHGENDEIPPPYASDNSSSAGSSTSSSNAGAETSEINKPESKDSQSATGSNDAPPLEPSVLLEQHPPSLEPTYEEIVPTEADLLPPPPSPEELNDTAGLTQEEPGATAVVEGVVNNGFQNDNGEEKDTGF